MTYKGYLMSITRHGANRNNTGPLMRCSFEETVEILLEAAAYAELDKLRGVSENIIMGQIAPVGTGLFGVFLNEDMLKHAVAVRFNDTDYPKFMSNDMGHGAMTPNFNASTPHYGYSPSSTSPKGNFTPSGGNWSPGAGFSPGYSQGGFSPSASGYSPTSPSYSRVPETPRASAGHTGPRSR